MKRVWLLALGLAACSTNQASTVAPRELPASPAGIDRAVIAKELETLLGLAERACACADTPCFEAVDEDLASFARDAILDDPVTDIDAWPTDLDALGEAAEIRMSACMLGHDFHPRGFGVSLARTFEGLRDAGCACRDAACAQRIEAAYDREKAALQQRMTPVGADAVQRSDAAASELRACIAGPLAEQAMLDLRAIRTAACACEDLACAEAQQAALQEWSAANEHTGVTEQYTAEEFGQVGEEIAACLR